MEKRIFLIVDTRTGECQLRRRKPSFCGFGETVIQLNLNIPEVPCPVVNITIPVPNTVSYVTEVKEFPFGINWALAEGILEIKGLDRDGRAILDYTDYGLERLALAAKIDLAKIDKTEELTEYAHREWGLPFIFIRPERLESILSKREEPCDTK